MSDVVIPESDKLSAVPADTVSGAGRRHAQHPPRKSVATVKSHPARESGPPKEGSGAKKVSKLIGVRVATSGMVFRFLSTLKEIKPGDAVLLQGKEEEVVGWVMFVVEESPESPLQERVYMGGFEKIIRLLSESERQFLKAREGLEQKAKLLCREKIRELKLPMRLSKVHYLPSGGKVVVYFTAENRVDFRELVRLLGGQLKVRVEMRHIGVRDETKLLGGLGLCGHELCCSAYLKRFHPVSVRMAKNQELSLNPEGISGTCGRLLCCLEYENATYQALREGLPKVKQTVQALDGREGVVQSVHPLVGRLDVQLTDGTRACFAPCELCGCGEARGADPFEAEGEEDDTVLPREEPPVEKVAKARPTGSTGAVKGSAVPNRRPEKKREPTREKDSASAGLGPPPALPLSQEAEPSALPVAPLVEGQAPAPAKKRRRRRRPSSTSDKKSTP